MTLILNGKLNDLHMRRSLCDFIIRTLMKEHDDPRAPDALEHYKAQLHQLDQKIRDEEKAERERLGIPEPEPIVVGVKSATVGAYTNP